MFEREDIVTTKYGNMPAFMAAPDDGKRYPGIIIYFDAPGMRQEMRNIAKRVANQGYFCILPDLYYRLGQLRFDIPRRDEAMSAVIGAAVTTLTNDMVYDDTAGLIAYLDAQDRVKPGRIGCVGYCMSGPFVLTVMARFPERMRAGAAMYGVKMVTDAPDSPHLSVGSIKGELFIGFAEVDPTVPENVPGELTAALDKAGTKYSLETIAGSRHGFVSPERKDYQPRGAEDTWKKIFAMWERQLKGLT